MSVDSFSKGIVEIISSSKDAERVKMKSSKFSMHFQKL